MLRTSEYVKEDEHPHKEEDKKPQPSRYIVRDQNGKHSKRRYSRGMAHTGDNSTAINRKSRGAAVIS